MKWHLTLALILCLGHGSIVGQDLDSTELAIMDVVRDFTMSISEKDSTKFITLFFTKDVAFTGVMSQETEWSIKKDYPEFQGLSISTAQRFIREICESGAYQKEDIKNLAIEYNGRIAHVEFDYVFQSDYKLIQWGHERWNLVFAEETWLITDVIYGIKFPTIEPVFDLPNR